MSTALPSDLLALQARVCQQLASELPAVWTTVSLHFEHYPSEGEVLEMCTASYEAAGERDDYFLSLEVADLLVELKTAMVRAGREPWTFVDLSLAATGAYSMDFGYGRPREVTRLYGPNA